MKNFIEFSEELNNILLNTPKLLEKTNSDDDLISKIESTIKCAEHYKHSYFWNSASSADNRRRNEKKFKENYPNFEFKFDENKYNVNFSYSESAKNVYFSLEILKNGKKSNITSLKNILKKLTDKKEMRKEKIKKIL
jgi:hypothetical protein